MPTNTRFKNISSINESTISDGLETNVIAYCNWGFLGIGGFQNVRTTSSGAYGGNQSTLRLAYRDGYTNGRVWEGFRKDWIWESGVDYTTQPISISGINVNGSFYPLNTSGAFAYKIDYPNGRIIFNSPISTSAVVTCEHSFRYIQFYDADAPWWKKVQQNSFRLDNSQFMMSASGAWSIPPEQRVQLPAVIVEAIPSVNRYGHEIGGLGQIVNQKLRFYILTETNADRKFIHDVLTEQTDKTIIGFDKNLMIQATGFPLNYDGTLATNAKTYPDLIKPVGQGGFEWKSIIFNGFRSYETEISSPLPGCVIEGTFQITTP